MQKLAAYSSPFATATVNPLDIHKEISKKNIEIFRNKGISIKSSLAPGMESGSTLDILQWLRFSSECYHISPHIEDYVMLPVIIMPSELPNRNGVGFPLQELTRFHPLAGRLSYKTFKGKPTHYEHKNDDITKAKGVIADALLRKMQGYSSDKVWKLVELLAFDRSKDPQLCNRILSNDISTYSMGAWIEGSTCSYCGKQKCDHINPKDDVAFKRIGDSLVYRRVFGIEGFETSAVESPAYLTALTDNSYVHDLRNT